MLNVFDIPRGNSDNDLLKLFSTYKKSISTRYFLKFNSDYPTEESIGVDITNFLINQPAINAKLQLYQLSNVKTEISINLSTEVKNLFKDGTGADKSYNGYMTLEIYLDTAEYQHDTDSNINSHLLSVTEGDSTPAGIYGNTAADQLLFKGRIKNYPDETDKQITMKFTSVSKLIDTYVYNTYDYAESAGIGITTTPEGQIVYTGNWNSGLIIFDNVYITGDNTIKNNYVFNENNGYLGGDGTYYSFSSPYNIIKFLILLAGYSESDFDTDINSESNFLLGTIDRTLDKNDKISKVLGELAKDLGVFIYQKTNGKWSVVSMQPTLNYDLELNDNFIDITKIKHYSDYKPNIILKYDYDMTYNEDGSENGEDYTRTAQKYDSSIAEEWPFESTTLNNESPWIKDEGTAYSKLDKYITVYQRNLWLIEGTMQDLGLALEIGDFIKITHNSKEYIGLVSSLSKNLSNMTTKVEMIYIEDEYDATSDYAKISASVILKDTQTIQTDSCEIYSANDNIDIWNEPISTDWYKDYIADGTKFKQGDQVVFVDFHGNGYEIIAGPNTVQFVIGDTIVFRDDTPLDTDTIQTNLNNGGMVLVTSYVEATNSKYRNFSADSISDPDEGRYF